MKSKFLYPSIGISIAIIIVLAFVFVLKLRERETSDAIRAIPIDAAIVFKVNSIGDLSTDLYNRNSFWAAIGGFSLVTNVNNFFDYSLKQKAKWTSYEQIVLKNQVYISVHIVGKGTPATLFAANIPERSSQNEVQTLINGLIAEDYLMSEKVYNNTKILQINGKGDAPIEFYLSLHQGVVILSESLLLVESALGQLGGGVSLLDDRSFLQALNTAGTKVNVSAFLNHTRFPLAFSSQIHPNYRNGFDWLSNTARWTELDLSIKDDSFYLNGFTQVSDTLNSFYRIFARQKPVKYSVTKVLPSQTASFVSIGISNLNHYFESYRGFQEGRGRLQAYNRNIDNFNKSVGFNITNLYNSIFGKELSIAYIPFEGAEYNTCWFIIAEVQSQSLAKQELLKAISIYAKNHNIPESNFERTFAVDRDKSVKIYKFPKAGLHSTLFGSLFSMATDQYFTFIDSYIVFGATVDALSRLILSNIHNKQMAVDNSFVEFSQGLTSEANFIAYINPSKAETLYGHLLVPSSAAQILSRMETMGKIQGVAMQLTGGRNMIFNNITARYTPYTWDAPQTVWETRLDTTITIKPQLVINHNTQNREIFVQDNKNSIYLINDVGRVLWKRPLPEPIIGEINQVDIFRNGRLQYLFNTRTSLYVIDRNGNNVEGFPVVLRSPATNAVAVFDYDNNRDYRFFVAGEDRKIQVYNRQGNIITGWEFDRTEKIVKHQISHFNYQRRDYIVVSDENRLYILDRRGTERVRVNQHFSRAPNSNIIFDANSFGTPRFVTTDTLGVVKQVSLNGEVKDVLLKGMSSNHFFDLQDVNGDGLSDYIFLDKKTLQIFNPKGDLKFNTKFKEEPLNQVVYFHFGARDRKLGVVSKDENQIFLINGDGSLYNGFPLKGSSSYSIGRFANTKSTFNLIVGSKNGYLLNYAVQ
jgi:hypothetical protein